MHTHFGLIHTRKLLHIAHHHLRRAEKTQYSIVRDFRDKQPTNEETYRPGSTTRELPTHSFFPLAVALALPLPLPLYSDPSDSASHGLVSERSVP